MAKKSAKKPRTSSGGGQTRGGGASKKSSAWARYQSLLVRHPLRMNMIQSSFISGLGNFTKQLAIDGLPLEKVDWVSVARSCFMAMFFVAPVITTWFRTIADFKLSVVVAVFVDQFIFSPSFNVYFFHVWTCLTGGLQLGLDEDEKDYVVHMRLKPDAFPSIFEYKPIWAAMTTSWMIWIPAAIVRQGQVPVHLRPVFNNMVSFFWQIVLAAILSS